MPPYPVLPASPPASPRLASTPNKVTVAITSFVLDQFSVISKGADEKDTWAIHEVKDYMRDWAIDWVEADFTHGDLSEDWPAAVGYMMTPIIERTIDWYYVTEKLNAAVDEEAAN
jgi:hypothetical protein